MSGTLETRRARSMQELAERSQLLFGRSASTDAEPYKPLPGDVIISPFAKCGTTWLQQIFHTLRTRGDMDFDDISRVVPWIETAPLLGLDINAPQRAEPRGFKSHASRDELPRGAKYIVSIRNPADALVSSFKFMEGWFLEPGSVRLDQFAQLGFIQSRRYWHHLASWWPHIDDDDVLIVSYEWMLAEPADIIRRVADFCGIALDDDLLALTLTHSSRQFMLDHQDRFDDRMMRDASEKYASLPPGSDSSKVQRQREPQILSQAILAELDAIWVEEITRPFGFPDYGSMESTLRHAAPA